MHPNQARNPARPSGRKPSVRAIPAKVSAIVAMLAVFAIGIVVVGPASAGSSKAKVSPKTYVATPESDSVVDGGDLEATGRASHRDGVAGVRVVVKNLDDRTYWNGSTWQHQFTRIEADMTGAGRPEATWVVRVSEASLADGRYRVRGFAYSVAGNGDAFGGDLVEFDYHSREDTPQVITVTEPVACGNRAILEPCTGLLLGSTGDFADANGSWQSPRQDFRQQEQRLGHRFDIFHEYNQWRDLVSRPWPSAETQRLADEGRIIFANWKSPSSKPSDWGRIAAGEFDADINAAAEQIAAFEQPVFLTFFHEPEDDIKRAAGNNQALEDELVADYAAAFAHIARTFDRAGADNAIWVWNIQGWLGHRDLYESGLYPGDDVVDWVSFNNYNWHGCDNHGNSRSWKRFDDVYRPFYEWLESPGPGRPGLDKPLMLGEWGTEENDNADNSSQSKAQWLGDAQQHFVAGTFPRIKSAVYFDTEGARPDGSIQFCRWGIDSSAASVDAFRTLMADPALKPTWE